MIPFASQRGLGQDLATHLLNAFDNETLEVAELRGAIASDLHGAFAEWELQAHSLTKCRKYLYSLSINPDPAQGPLTREQYDDYIHRVEEKLGLSGQPRAVVFHEKYGREHCHVVWSRIDAEKGKAVHMAFDKEKLMMVTREFARDHGLTLPSGYARDGKEKSGQLSLYEMHQKRVTGLSREERMAEITDAWRASDSPKAFVQALAARGYILATGKRPYVLVDLYGEMNALPKMIADKNVRTKDVRAFLEKEFPPESLPDVEEARKLVAQHRKVIEAYLKEEQRNDAREALKQAQTKRREKIEKDRTALRRRHHEDRQRLLNAQKKARTGLRDDHLAESRGLRREREERRPRGLAAFLGRVSGVDLLRRKINKYQDKKRMRMYLSNREQLKNAQAEERHALAQRQKLQELDLKRRIKALDQIDRREKRALEQALKADARAAARGRSGRIPPVPLPESVRVLLDQKPSDPKRYAFNQAAGGKAEQKELVLSKHFSQAAKSLGNEKETKSGDKVKPGPTSKIRRYRRNRRSDKNLDRER